MSPTSYYRRVSGHIFEPTEHAGGTWRDTEQHMAPAAGLLVHELLRFQPREEMIFARFSFEILGTIHFRPFQIHTRVLRPGKTIELLQAELVIDDRPAIRCTAWRLVTSDTAAVQLFQDAAMTPRSECAAGEDIHQWPGGYIASLTGLQDPAAAQEPGRNALWISHNLQMVAGEETHPLTKLLGMVDTANGAAPAVDPNHSGYIFPNVDLQIHLYRQPSGDWLGLDTTVNFGADGVGLTSSVLNDETGPFGRAEQILTLRKIR